MVDYEKEAESRFLAAEEALEHILRLEAELEARMAHRNLEGSLQVTGSLLDAIVKVRGILGELKTLKNALRLPSIPPGPPVEAPVAPKRLTHQSSSRTKVEITTPVEGVRRKIPG